MNIIDWVLMIFGVVIIFGFWRAEIKEFNWNVDHDYIKGNRITCAEAIVCFWLAVFSMVMFASWYIPEIDFVDFLFIELFATHFFAVLIMNFNEHASKERGFDFRKAKIIEARKKRKIE